MATESTESGSLGDTGWFSLPAMIYPNGYLLLIFVSTLDIVLTWAILSKRDGVELNPIAAVVIDSWGLMGAIVFKFSLMLIVIVICETVGRHRHSTGRRLVIAAVAISSFPPVYSLGLLSWRVWTVG